MLEYFEKAMGRCTAQSKMLPFRAKTIVRESVDTELARLKKEEEEERKKKEKHLARFASSWFGTFAMLSRAIGSLVSHENTRR